MTAIHPLHVERISSWMAVVLAWAIFSTSILADNADVDDEDDDGDATFDLRIRFNKNRPRSNATKNIHRAPGVDSSNLRIVFNGNGDATVLTDGDGDTINLAASTSRTNETDEVAEEDQKNLENRKALASKIVRRTDAKPGQFPYQALIGMNSTEANRFKLLCGGSLIQKNWVLSAAHCFFEGGDLRPLSDLSVVLGEHNRSAVFEPHVQWHEIKRAIFHKEWYNPEKSRRYVGDVVLVELRTEATINDRVQMIDLPLAENHEPTGLATLTGWIDPMTSLTSYKDVLQYATYPIIPIKECYNTFERNNALLRVNTSVHVCAGAVGDESGRDFCLGDSGAPLVCSQSSSSSNATKRAVLGKGAIIEGRTSDEEADWRARIDDESADGCWSDEETTTTKTTATQASSMTSARTSEAKAYVLSSTTAASAAGGTISTTAKPAIAAQTKHAVIGAAAIEGIEPKEISSFDHRKVYQCGIASFGQDCNSPKYPRVFTNIAYYLPWIRSAVQNIKRGPVADGESAGSTLPQDQDDDGQEIKFRAPEVDPLVEDEVEKIMAESMDEDNSFEPEHTKIGERENKKKKQDKTRKVANVEYAGPGAGKVVSKFQKKMIKMMKKEQLQLQKAQKEKLRRMVKHAALKKKTYRNELLRRSRMKKMRLVKQKRERKLAHSKAKKKKRKSKSHVVSIPANPFHQFQNAFPNAMLFG